MSSSKVHVLLRTALLAVVVTVAGLVVQGCGPSDARRAAQTYRASASRLLEREPRVWKRFTNLLDERDTRPAPYYLFVTREALPFFEDLLREVQALGPVHPSLETAHAHLLRFAERRLSVLHGELDGRKLMERIARSHAIAEFQAAQDRAEDTVTLYQRTLDETPRAVHDARFTQLKNIRDAFWSDYVKKLESGAIEEGAVRERLRKHVRPRVEELLNSRFLDDPLSGLVRSCIAEARAFYVAMEETLPEISAAQRLNGRTASDAREAQEALKNLRDELARVERQE